MAIPDPQANSALSTRRFVGLSLSVWRRAGCHARQQPAHVAGLLIGGDELVERLEIETERRQPARCWHIVSRAGGHTLRLDGQFAKAAQGLLSAAPWSAFGAPAGGGGFRTHG